MCIFNFFITIGFVFQVYCLLKKYMEFKTGVRVIRTPEYGIKLPPVQICFEFNITDFQTLLKWRPKHYTGRSLSSNEIRRVILRMPVSDLDKYGNLGNMKIDCAVECSRNPEMLKKVGSNEICENISCELYSPIRNMILYTKHQAAIRCFGFLIKSNSQEETEKQGYFEEPINLLATLIKISILSDFTSINSFIFFSRASLAPYAANKDYKKLKFSHRAVVEVDFRVTTHIKQEDPYDTGCRHYTEYGVLKRDQCLEDCISSESIERYV